MNRCMRHLHMSRLSHRDWTNISTSKRWLLFEFNIHFTFSLAALHSATLFLSSRDDLSQMATWQGALQYGVMSDVSCVNCPTLDQTYWFLSVGTWIFWAVCFSSRMITFSSSHWYFIIIVLLPPTVQTTTANCPSEKQLCYGCLSFPSY